MGFDFYQHVRVYIHKFIQLAIIPKQYTGIEIFSFPN